MRIGQDLGHGGKDPGAIGPTGLHEAEVNLAVGLKLAEILKRHGLEVVSTRTEDKAVSLTDRVKVLDKARCDYVVSIHCNSSPHSEANYISTFIQAKGGQAEQLAKAVQKRMVEATGWPDGEVRVANLHMTRETDAPAVIVEMGFISNPEQETQLKAESMREALAEAIAKGLLDYLGIEFIPFIPDLPLPLAAIKVGGRLIGGVNIDGRVYAPVRALAEALGATVDWDDKTKTVLIN